MVSFICIFIAGALNAVMDRIENENFYVSIFSKLNEKFWYKRESWKHAKKTFGYKWDAWHITKSLMIICLCLAIVMYKSVFNIWIEFIVLGLIWNGSFNLFYNRILKK